MSLAEAYRAVRAQTDALAAPLGPEDQALQSMPDASPTKWHRAHTTWFFETFVLGAVVPGYAPVDPRHAFLFNSYYEALGARQPRPRRGMLTRPTTEEIGAYRAEVDARMVRALDGPGLPPEIAFRVVLGLNHEQQHQELLLTDIQHALFQNPLRPAYARRSAEPPHSLPPAHWIAHPGGIVEIGHGGDPSDPERFAFDNETPRHRVLLEPFALASRPTTCGEYRAFVDDGGYRRPELWLSDGWSMVQAEGWDAPLYWDLREGTQFTLAGVESLEDDAPVSHVSFYEADAFARWAGARLPLEAEWETLAAAAPLEGRFVETGAVTPRPAPAQDGLVQIYGDVWEWTASPYVGYPRFRPLAGDLGEYNGKFMCNQLVLRGGSCLSPRSHLRATYRNFFPPAARWQMSGIRLARWE